MLDYYLYLTMDWRKDVIVLRIIMSCIPVSTAIHNVNAVTASQSIVTPSTKDGISAILARNNRSHFMPN